MTAGEEEVLVEMAARGILAVLAEEDIAEMEGLEVLLVEVEAAAAELVV